MISSAIKKFANQNGLACCHGVAYGTYKGYLLTLEDGSGTKRAAFAIHCSDEAQQLLRGFLANPDCQKSYRLRAFDVTTSSVELVFHDTIGTMPKLTAFLDVVTDQLHEMGVAGVEVCPHCGLAHQPGQEKHVLINRTVYAMHQGCVSQLRSQMEDHAEAVKKEGSVLTGTLGAIVGGLIGSIPWAIAYYLGWFVGWLGFVVGLAAKKGYEFAHGKETKAKIFVVALVSAICVIFAQYFIISVSLIQEIDFMELTLLDSMRLLLGLLLEDADVQIAFMKDVLLGWLFAGFGIFSNILQMSSDTRRNTATPIDLD